MDVLAALAAPARQRILQLTWGRERSAGDIAAHFDVTFGAVSQHLGVLRDAGFVTVRPEGNRRYYRADRRALGPLAQALEASWASALDRLAAAVEAEPDPGRRRPRR